MLREGTGPLLLITGGVGQTPALPLAEQALAAGRKVIYVHAALNGSVHAFREQVDRLAERHDTLKPVYCYADPQPGDRPHMVGLLDQDRLGGLLPKEAGVAAYVVGPKPFMAAVVKALTALGLPESAIVHEFFGPREALA